jgi:hypothetical protein
MHLNVNGIVELAREPAPFVVPIVTVISPTAAADWADAAGAAERRAIERRTAYGDGAPRLNATTIDFIKNGAEVGDRHDRTFRAAANLMELAADPRALIHALLTEAALDTGLTPSDVRRQVDCGIAHAQRQHEGPDA